ncbi:MAG: 4-hydroxybenzoate octaprenyltransferase [Rhizobiaceae bacterium]
MNEQQDRVADAVQGHWVYRFLPQWIWPYAQLARWERPIGWQLLMWPCWWSAALALSQLPSRNGTLPQLFPRMAIGSGGLEIFVLYLLLFTLGAFVMRGAGCTYNDLVDQDIDDRIARTRSRPLPSGRVTRRQAKLFLVLQLVAGLAILLCFNWTTVLLGCLSLVTVIIYPFMKRVTWWPQLFLGFAFSWGALMGWPALLGSLDPAPLVLYVGCICWVIGYDTIYALQDIEDDALVGVRSTARLFGSNARLAISALYAAALTLFALASWLAGANWPAWLALVLGAMHMAWQMKSLDLNSPQTALKLFKSNNWFGWIVFLGFLAAALMQG